MDFKKIEDCRKIDVLVLYFIIQYKPKPEINESGESNNNIISLNIIRWFNFSEIPQF
jgi:hypothetical protein